MKKNAFKRIMAIALALTMCFTCLALTGCGNKADKETAPEKSAAEESVSQADVSAQEDGSAAEDMSAQEEGPAEVSGPVTVDAIEADVTAEWTTSYHDDKEGYDRELTGKESGSLKFIDYSLITGEGVGRDDIQDVTVIALHFKADREYHFYNADGSENTDSYINRYAYRILDENGDFDIEVRQDATNVDTGETEELELDSAIREYFADYNIEFSIQENIIKWKEEKGLKGAQWIMEFVGDEPLYYDYPNPYAGDGWCFPNYLGTDYVVFEGEQVYKTMDDYEYPMDVYYFYQLQNPTAPVVVTVHTNDDNYASTTKPVDQVMTINIA